MALLLACRLVSVSNMAKGCANAADFTLVGISCAGCAASRGFAANIRQIVFFAAGGQWDSSSGLGLPLCMVTRLTGPVWCLANYRAMIGVYVCRGSVQLKVCVYDVMTNVCCGRTG